MRGTSEDTTTTGVERCSLWYFGLQTKPESNQAWQTGTLERLTMLSGEASEKRKEKKNSKLVESAEIRTSQVTWRIIYNCLPLVWHLLGTAAQPTKALRAHHKVDARLAVQACMA